MAGESILVVDDNPINLKLVRVTLAVAGYQVRTAIDAEDAVRVLQDYRPALILMDIQLPGMDGLTLTRQLKAEPALRGVPIVALTAYAMKGDDDKAYASGCAGYIIKPIDTRTFADTVAQFLRGAVRTAPAGGGEGP